MHHLLLGGRKQVNSCAAETFTSNFFNADTECDYYTERKIAERASNEMNNIIKEQLALRKGGASQANSPATEIINTKICRVRNACSTKVLGLKVSTREDYLTRIINMLQENVAKANIKQPDEVFELSYADYEAMAIELEYGYFQKTNCFTNYRHGCVSLVNKPRL